MTEYIDHNLIVEDAIDRREYQDYLMKKGLENSCLIVLPTGTGKTIVSLRITAERLLNLRGGTSLLLAPTKPLVEQHYDTYSNLLDIMDDNIVMFSGDVRPDKRAEIWNDNPSVVISTPQVIENDLISGRISLENVIHLTFDECHRATGDYSYVYIADKYIQQRDDPLITGLSASPGDDKESILQVCNNINVQSIEIITENDPMIEDYVYDTEIETRWVEISDTVLDIRDMLQEVYKDRLEYLYDEDYIDSRSKTLSQSKLNKARSEIQKAISQDKDGAYQAMSRWAEAMKINRAITQIETQGIESFIDYYERLEDEMKSEDSSRAVERLVSDHKIQKAVKKAREYDGKYKKFEVLRSELVNSVKIDGGKALVFTKSRDTVEALVDELQSDFNVGRLVGQSDTNNSKGMTQKEQKESVRMFSNNEYEVLISTQIGEEGLDISEVDLVVFYEPAVKGIENIQRQGRTGRTKKGRVVMLIGKNTRDVGMYYKSKNSVEDMKSDVQKLQNIGNIKDEIESELKDSSEQKTLEEITDKSLESEDIEDPQDIVEDKSDDKSDDTEDVKENIDIESEKYNIICDSRETNSSVVRTLDMDDDVGIDIQNNLEVGDYIVGNECGIERKDIDDFHDTITGDRSIFEQIKNLSNAYNNPILILEGSQDELYQKNIHQNAIRSILSSIAVDFNTSIIHSKDEEDTAGYIKYLAKRSQDEEESVVNPHGNKETGSIREQQIYIVSSIEGIGPKTAERLLDHFGNIQSIFNADVEDLKSVENIHNKTANRIHSLIRKDFAEEKH